MGHLLAVALTFPAVVYTVLLGVALVYWVFVMSGALHIGGGEAADGAIEGATKGVIEGAADDFGDGDFGDGDAAHGGTAGIMAALKLRSAPATVVLSVIVLFSWIFAVLGVKGIEAVLPDGGIGATLAKVALLVLAPIVALFPASFAVRPLARIFTPLKATTREQLVGKLCTIRTGTVTDRFGEATLEDGGAGVVVRVRVDSGEKLGRGDKAVIVGYDADRQEFTVAPMDDVFEERGHSR